jgi:flagellar operon protein
MTPISNNSALVPPGPVTTATDPNAPARGAGGDRVNRGAPSTPDARTAATPGSSFADALEQAGAAGAARSSGDLSFSKHALARVQRRGIELGASTLGRLSQGVDRAASKGSRDSLVLVDGTAFVVSVSNRTVITAVGSEHMKDNVFTNIDSAVIA